MGSPDTPLLSRRNTLVRMAAGSAALVVGAAARAGAAPSDYAARCQAWWQQCSEVEQLGRELDAETETYKPGDPPAALMGPLPGLWAPCRERDYWSVERLTDVIEEYQEHYAACLASGMGQDQRAAPLFKRTEMAARSLLPEAEAYDALVQRWNEKDDEANAIFDAAREAMDDAAHELIVEPVHTARDLQRKIEIATKVGIFWDTSKFGEEARAAVFSDIESLAKAEV